MEIQLSPPKQKLMENFTSVILCAGEGIRAKEIANDIPKPLIKVESLKNQSILSILITHLYKFGIKPIVIVTGYLGEQIERDIISSRLKNPHISEIIILNNAGNQYKLGPLHSFLSITRNKQVFNTDKLFIVFPGDTIFNYNIIKEILDLVKENSTKNNQNSMIFYRRTTKLELNKEPEKFGALPKKKLSCVRTKERGLKQYVEEIYQKNIESSTDVEEFKQIIPIFIITYEYVKKLEKLANEIKLNKISDAINSSIQNKIEFLACEVKSDQSFFDIDTALDLTYVNNFYKKSGQ